MTDEDGAVKITDFGIAKITAVNNMTETSTVVGTPNYMSPEQVQGLEIDGRSDQFSLAVIAYEILTGERPFQGEHLSTVVYKIVAEEPAGRAADQWHADAADRSGVAPRAFEEAGGPLSELFEFRGCARNGLRRVARMDDTHGWRGGGAANRIGETARTSPAPQNVARSPYSAASAPPVDCFAASDESYGDSWRGGRNRMAGGFDATSHFICSGSAVLAKPRVLGGSSF